MNCLETNHHKKKKNKSNKKNILNCWSIGMVLIQGMVLQCISLALEDKL